MSKASPWARAQSFVPRRGREAWLDRHEPGPLERIALDAQAERHVDPDLLEELVRPDSRVTSLARAARLPLRFDRGSALRLAARAPLGTARVLAGRSRIAPAPGDRRFAAEAWEHNFVFRRLLQAYLGAGAALDELIDGAELDWRTERRLRLAAENLVQALAPTNFVLTNPEALKRVIDTGGRSLLAGLRALARDMATEPRIPASVDASRFGVGRNLAVSPGAVVLRTATFELIQYAPATERVHAVPMLIVSSMVNKYYVLDLSPGRSLIEHLVAQGHTVFAISWRNPEARHAQWGLERYARSVLAALDAMAEITGERAANVMALCAGGLVAAAAACAMTEDDGDERLRSLTLSVCPLDSDFPNAGGSLIGPRMAPRVVAEAARRGYVEGHQVAGAFAWLRPNEGVWSYAVNNYLLGKAPPAVDILYWAADSTNIPAALNHDLTRLSLENAFVAPSDMRCLGAPLDLGRIRCDAYLIAAESDHLTPWQSCYTAAGLLGGRTRFILSSGGHIGATVNPPERARGGFWTGATRGRDHDAWRASARLRGGSWWPDWIAWLRRRSGPRGAAPSSLGSVRNAVLEPAPGRYVRESTP